MKIKSAIILSLLFSTSLFAEVKSIKCQSPEVNQLEVVLKQSNGKISASILATNFFAREVAKFDQVKSETPLLGAGNYAGISLSTGQMFHLAINDVGEGLYDGELKVVLVDTKTTTKPKFSYVKNMNCKLEE